MPSATDHGNYDESEIPTLDIAAMHFCLYLSWVQVGNSDTVFRRPTKRGAGCTVMSRNFRLAVSAE